MRSSRIVGSSWSACLIDGARLILVDKRDAPEVLCVRLMPNDGPATERVLRVHRLGGMPRLPLEVERKARAEEVRLAELRSNAAIER